MKTLNQQLSMYAAYHRDPRNVATHFVGIPMIVVSVAALLARAALSLGGATVSLAHLAVLGTLVFYFLLDRRFGLAMTIFMGASLVAGIAIADLPLRSWLAVSIGLFVVGWIFQAVGHVFEGRKPAFVDDLIGLLVGPLFIVAEVAVAAGLRSDVRASIAAR
jgi:uncharacterized membrane protein YGL010W